MRNVKWLIAAGLIAATTAACTEQYGYPSTSYNSGYNNGYYANSAYRPNYAYNTSPGYVYSTSPGYVYSTSPNYAYSNPRPSRYGPNGDYDRDGIPNKYDRDANGDGIPDRRQR
jgi:hypothetical protein